VDGLSFAEPTTHVYNPLNYARDPIEKYLDLAGANRKEVILLGMNPGPWGMAQTGVPFGTIKFVRDWLCNVKKSAAIGSGVGQRTGSARRISFLNVSLSPIIARWCLWKRLVKIVLRINYQPLKKKSCFDFAITHFARSSRRCNQI